MSQNNHHTNKTWLERLGDLLVREPHTKSELLDLLQEAMGNHLLSLDALRMIEGVLQVAEMQVRDVMIPRAQMVVLDQDLTPAEALPLVIESAHSRYPVINDNKDEVVGILMAKDLLPFCLPTFYKPQPRILTLVRPTVFVPESKRLDVLLKEFQRNRSHMAVVVDEYGGVSGLITIEDVLEQIVGDIIDEYDTQNNDDYIKLVQADQYLVKGLCPIELAKETFQLDITDDEEANTIAGFVGRQFGYLPKRGEKIQVGQYEVTVLQASARQIHLLKFLKVDEPASLNTTEE